MKYNLPHLDENQNRQYYEAKVNYDILCKGEKQLESDFKKEHPEMNDNQVRLALLKDDRFAHIFEKKKENLAVISSMERINQNHENIYDDLEPEL